jgi:hypothetical protein
MSQAVSALWRGKASSGACLEFLLKDFSTLFKAWCSAATSRARAMTTASPQRAHSHRSQDLGACACERGGVCGGSGSCHPQSWSHSRKRLEVGLGLDTWGDILGSLRRGLTLLLVLLAGQLSDIFPV